MSSPSTFNLGSVLRALGVRDPRVLPSVDPTTITPTVNFGNFNAFTGQVIEARTILNEILAPSVNGTWRGCWMLSVAPGGTIIEALGFDNLNGIQINLAPELPFNAPNVTPFSIGGQRAVNLFAVSDIDGGPNPPPTGFDFGGSGSTRRSGFGPWPTLQSASSEITRDIWVPPGWYFWITYSRVSAGQPQVVFFAIRSREIPQMQGPA